MTDEGVWPIGDDGRYGYDVLDRFWQHPYLFRVDGALAGFEAGGGAANNST